MNDELRAAYEHLKERLARDKGDELGNACIDMPHAEVILRHLAAFENIYLMEPMEVVIEPGRIPKRNRRWKENYPG